MRVALVHDWLNTKEGGAENVFFEMCKIYPQADIFCLVFNKNRFGDKLKNRNIKTSFLQKYPAYFKNNPMYFLPFIKSAVKSFDFSGYDLVISSSTAWVKNINTEGARHVCYCHSPARMMWDSWPRYVLEKKPKPAKLFYITHLVSKLRLWDYYRSKDVDSFLANSRYISGRIKKFYGRESNVIYPFIDYEALKPKKIIRKGDYYLVLSVLAKYKNIDMIIEAFKKNGRKLIIAGDGPDKKKLVELGGNAENITFRGRVTENEKIKLLQQARGFVFANIEDFGITPVEAMAAATPVIALHGGGVSETVTQLKTGVFFDSPNAQSINAAIEQFESIDFDYDYISKQAVKFDRKVFVKKFKEATGARND